MPTFSYEVLDPEGNIKRGEMDAPNERIVIQKLRDARMTIKNISQKEISRKFDIKAQLASFQRVNEQALTVFSRQFATMINAGLAMVRCLDILAQQTEDKKLQETLLAVKKDVEGGSTLSNALGRHPSVFSNLYISMVRAGEVGGVLDEVLDRVAMFLEKDFTMKKKVQSAMTYPGVIFLMSIGIMTFLVTYILPTFVELFEGMNLALPLPTKILIMVTKGVKNPVVLLTGAIVIFGGAVLFNRYNSTTTGKRQIDKLKLMIPVFGMLIRKVAISRFCRTLGTLLGSGVPIMQALDIVGKASGNEVIAMTVVKVRESIREGESIAGPLGTSGIFPPMVTQMVAVGEETGNLDAMLSKIADFYDTEVDYMLSSLTSLLEPIMILGMGFMVGFIVVAIFMPMYQIIGKMGN